MRNRLLKERDFKVGFSGSGRRANKSSRKKGGLGSFDKPGGLWEKKAMRNDMKGGRPEREESDGEVWELR